MRNAVERLVQLGSLPGADDVEEDRLIEFERLLKAIMPPVTDDEARALAKLFGPDDCYGLAWTLLHLIETAPGWPLQDVVALTGEGNEWTRRLRERAERGGLL